MTVELLAMLLRYDIIFLLATATMRLVNIVSCRTTRLATMDFISRVPNCVTSVTMLVEMGNRPNLLATVAMLFVNLELNTACITVCH